jgi:hypothetical protein
VQNSIVSVSDSLGPISNCIFTQNTVSNANGGTLVISGDTSTMAYATISNTTIVANHAGLGGRFYTNIYLFAFPDTVFS